ncbi:uncharacterized protein LOC128036171 [Gossypium raimondii]|uniref:uncharacterized protein LOC128036171 n=1 Tax=Gossypium raimondii TaxID=29730 RepID=UPI00227D31EA|nr:uncharacterized protein LOC128036171 [Gossypium raimondii]
MVIDANEALLAKSYNEAYEILERISNNNYQWSNTKAPIERRILRVHEVDALTSLGNQVIQVTKAQILEGFWKMSKGDIDHNDVYDMFQKLQQQLDEHDATLRTLSTTFNEVRLNQDPHYRDPINEDRDNQPHRRGPRRVPRMDDDFHDRGQPSLAKPKSEQQREHLFHTRCHVQGKLCRVIIDGESCSNIASTTMVEKLCLTATKHPQPYQLQGLSNEGQFKVTQQVRIAFSIGKYQDEVVCDVVPMQACHLLLGEPWQLDRKVTHDGRTNRFPKDRKITFNFNTSQMKDAFKRST